jgi:hypothetical protein
MQSYAVATTLSLNDRLTGGLTRVVDLLRVAQREVGALQRSLNRLGMSFRGSALRIDTAGLRAAQDVASRRQREDLRAMEAGIARMQGNFVNRFSPVRSTGVPGAAGELSPSEIAALDQATTRLRLRDAVQKKRDEADLEDQKRRAQARLEAADRREKERTAKYIFRLQQDQQKQIAAAERRSQSEQAAEVARAQRERSREENYLLRTRMRYFAQQQRAEEAAEARRAREAERLARAPKPPIIPPIFHGGGHGGGHGYLSRFGEMGREAEHFGRMGLVGGILYGAYERGVLTQEVNRTLLATAQNVRTSPFRGQIQDIIQSQAGALALPIPEVGAAVTEQLKMLGNLPMAERLKLLPSMLQWARVETLINPEVSLRSAIGSTAGLMHQWQHYTPEQIQRLQPVIAALSTVGGGITIPSIEAAAGYTAATAQTTGIGMETILAMIAAGKVSGITNTKAGTWIEGLLKIFAPKGGFLSLMNSKAGQRRLAAMVQLGLIGRNGEPIGLEMLQRGDVIGFQHLLASHLPPPGMARETLLTTAAGTAQAGRELEQLTLPGFATAIASIEKRIQQFGGAGPTAMINEYAATDPFFQFNKALADARNALIDLDRALPLLTAAINGLDQTIKAILPASQGGTKGNISNPTTTLGSGALGAWIGTMFGPLAPLTIPLLGLGGAALPGFSQAAREQGGTGYTFDPNGMLGGAIPLDVTSGSKAKGKSQGWLDWLLSFIIPSAHAAEMPSAVAASPVAQQAGKAIAKATGTAMTQVDYTAVGQAIASAVVRALGSIMSGTGGGGGGSLFGGIGGALSSGWNAIKGLFGGSSSAVPGGAEGTALGLYYNYLLKKGLDPEHAAALIAQVHFESGGGPGKIGDNGTSIGLFQEHAGRALAMAKAVPNWRTNWQGQIDYALDEMRRIDPAWFSHHGAALLGAEASHNFEAPRDQLGGMISRGRFAQLYLNGVRKLPGAPPALAKTADDHAQAQQQHTKTADKLTDAVNRLHETLKSFGGPDNPLFGDVHMDGEKVGHVVAKHLEKSVRSTASNGMARSGARPSFEMSNVLPPPM